MDQSAELSPAGGSQVAIEALSLTGECMEPSYCVMPP
jgi:hypothetical protein